MSTAHAKGVSQYCEVIASCCAPARLGSKSQTKKKGVKSNLRKEFDRMAQTSGGWDNDEEDEEQGYSAEEMDIDAAAGGSAAVSGPVPPIITPRLPGD